MGCKESAQFPCIPEIKHFNDTDKEFLTTELHLRTEEIKQSLGELKNKCSKWLSDHFTPLKFKCVLRNIDGTHGVKMLSNNERELEEANSNAALMKIIYEYVSWYNYGLLNHVMRLCTEGLDEYNHTYIQETFQHYEEQLINYYKRRVFECPPPSNAKQSGDTKYFVLKIDVEFQYLTYGKIHDHFQHNLSAILNIYPHALHLRLVLEGCTELVYFIPKCVYNLVFPLSNKQWEELKSLGVHQVSTERYSRVSDQ